MARSNRASTSPIPSKTASAKATAKTSKSIATPTRNLKRSSPTGSNVTASISPDPTDASDRPLKKVKSSVEEYVQLQFTSSSRPRRSAALEATKKLTGVSLKKSGKEEKLLALPYYEKMSRGPGKKGANTAKKDTAKKDTPKKDTPKKDTPMKNTPKKDTPKKDTPMKDTPMKKDTPKKAAAKKETPKEDTPKRATKS